MKSSPARVGAIRSWFLNNVLIDGRCLPVSSRSGKSSSLSSSATWLSSSTFLRETWGSKNFSCARHCSSREGGRRPVYRPVYIAYAIRAFAAFRVSNLGRDLGFIRSTDSESRKHGLLISTIFEWPLVSNQCIIIIFWTTTNAEFYRKALNPFYFSFKRLESLKRLTRNRGSLPTVSVTGAVGI